MQKRKIWIGITVAVVAVALVVAGLLLHREREQQQLEEQRNEALLELERNAGQYDEQSIVLYETSKAKAEELAELYNAQLRITENGRFATLTLPEGTTIRDVYAMDESLKYIDEMAADYQVKVSELETEEEEEGDRERLPMRPQYSVSDSDYELQTYLDYLNMGNAWNNYTGSGITVAVIDTGIDTDHPEFAGRISEYSYNATEDKIVKDWDYDWSLIEDEVGHGTAVTGVIAAAMDGSGIVGIAPNVEIIVIKAECDQNGNFARTSDLVYGLYYAIERDVQVVNMSFGTYAPINPFAEATQLAYDSDMICVAAAGNEGTSALCWPAADENVIGVGALGEGWELADYSNYGENTNLVAPGSTYTCEMGGGYATTQGTSLASPIVAGAIVLYMQNNPYTTFDKVTEVLYASCYDLGDLGRDWDYGFGALDISALIQEPRGTIHYDMLTDELENEEGLYIQGHTLQELPEPERLYAVFDGWYYDDTFTQEYNYYADKFYGEEITLYAKWVNEDDGIPYTYVILEDGTVEIRSYTGHRRFITIPEKIDGRIVSSIGDFAFSGQTRLREVGLPSGLRHIGRYAFQNCANLVQMQIPANVTELEEYAFSGNVRLSTVALQSGSKLQSVGDFAFKSCGKLERFELPASLESINGSAFYGATALNSITVQAGNGHFMSKDGVLFNLTGSTLVAYPAAHGSSYTLPTETKTIATFAFAFAKIKTIDLSNVETIADAAFVYAALETLNIPDCVTIMGESAFAYNVNLSQLTIGRGLNQIAAEAFAKATSLKAVTIPNGIGVIGKSAFAGGSLQSVIFEENSTLTLIGDSAFCDCSISEIDIPASVLKIGMKAFSGTMVGNPLVRVGFAENAALHTIGGGAFAKCWLLEEIQLPVSLQIIGAQAFMSTALREVTIPASVTNLGAGTFACCANLTAITVEEGNTVYRDMDGVVHNLDTTEIHAFPAGKEVGTYYIENTVRTIMPWAFAGTAKLGSVVLPEGLTEVGEYGLYLSGIYSVTLPETLEEIQQYAFAECSNLYSVHIPDNVLQIGRYAFAYDWNLYSVTFNETSKLPRISFGAFAYCGINSFRVPANVSTMAQKAFEGCRNLTSFTFAANSKLESISAYMFDGCSNLQTITFENGSALTSIQAHGLEGMDKLTSIHFGDAKLSNVDNFAFRFCESLSTLNLPETTSNIGRYAFYGCKNLAELTIPANVEHIGSYAFLGTNDISLYFESETLPLYLDENWDHATKGYYTGVTSVQESGDWKYASLTSGNIAILEYRGEATNIDLTTLNLGAEITIIGGSAFEGSAVQQIVLPNTLEAIQAEAFAYSALESVTIPASVTFIGREAFAYTDIATLAFAAGSKLSVMEQYAFVGTKNLQTVTLPASLTTMGTGVFQQSGLTSVIFENGIRITEIPQKAFAETRLTSVALPDSVTLVNHNAFNNVQTLKSVTFGNNEGIRLMSNAFYHTGLESLHIPANVTYIGEYCFVALNNLTSFSVDENNPNYKAVDGLLLNKSGRKLIAVPAGRTGSLTVPEGVEEIGFGAFEESKLSEIQFLPDANILTFGYRAFFKANNITTISVPKSVVSIDYYAFAYCENVQEVIFAEDNQLKGIYEGAFLGCINLENITIPDSIVEISDFAFYGCSKIDRLPISENSQVLGIYDYAFAYTGLNGEFTTPETLWDIGNYAFLGNKFTKVTIPDANKKILVIGIGAFEDCNKLEEITLPFIGASFEDEEISWFGYIFGAGAYEANGTYVPVSLKTVTITDGITNIYVGGFAYCTGLETINVPHSVSVLWNDAFKETTARYELTNTIVTYLNGHSKVSSSHFGKGIYGNLTLADGLTDIGYKALYECKSLTGITIPDSVASIGNWAFYNCGSLTDVTLPHSIISIGNDAFNGCSDLTNITIPGSATSIGDSAFARCDSLTYVTILDGVTSIGSAAFAWCSSLTSITIPEGVTSIGDWTFHDCSSLTNITIPGSVTSIGDSAFYDCRSLTSITIPEGVTSIGNDAFNGCSDLTNITIPGSVTSIGDSAFARCDSLTYVTILDGVTNIGEGAFIYCSSLMNITIPSSVITIGNLAFFACNNLQEIHVPENGHYRFENGILYDNPVTEIIWISPRIFGNVSILDGVTSIGNDAFRNCRDLISLTIPKSVISIGDYAFNGCNNLKKVTNKSELELQINSEAYGYVAYYAIVLEDAEGNKTYRDDTYFETEDHFLFSYSDERYILYAYLGTEDTITLPSKIHGNIYSIYQFRGARSVIVPSGITSINGGAFYDCSSLTSITIPDGICSIGEEAFYGCSSLTSITIPDSVTSIGGYAFYGCSSLTSITIPGSITSIGAFVFCYCSSLTNVMILDGVDRIGYMAFRDCESLVGITIPDSVTSIDNSAFEGCSSLTSITIPDSVTSIGSSAFSGCSNLQEIHMTENEHYRFENGILYDNPVTTIIWISPKISGRISILDGVYSINPSLFSGYSGLTSIIIPESVRYIGWAAFENCDNLTSITIPGSVTSIGGSAFHGCSSLTSIAIPEGVTSIGDWTFRACSSLTNITIPDSVTSIGSSAFGGCSSLTSITIPDGVTSIGSFAFEGCSSLTSITIPDGVTSIGSLAFHGCSSLTSITIPEGVTSIGDLTFRACSSLTNITIPDSVTSIGSSAFEGCSSLSSITIPEGVTSIGSSAFSGCSSLTSITIPDSMTSIGSSAFSGCSNLQEIHVTENGHYRFENGILYDNPATKIIWISRKISGNVSIIDGVCKIDDYAFEGCNRLTSITIPDSVTSIGVQAFYDCSNLISVTIPDSVTTIGNYAFSHCSSLTSLTIGNSVISIGDYAFNDCNNLKKVTNKSELELQINSEAYGYVAYYAIVLEDAEGNKTYRDDTYFETEDHFLFSYSDERYILYAYLGTEDTITLPSKIHGNIYSIDQFRGARSVIVPSGITSINGGAFYGCSSLTSITIPDSVTSIGSSAFYGCSSLTSITIPDSVTSIGGYAFYGCSSLTSITIPDSVTSIGAYAFCGCSSLYTNPAYYQNGLLIIDSWLIDVDENLRYLTNVEQIRGVVGGAYDDCHLLKNAVWGNATLPSNVETLYIHSINSGTPYLRNLPLTLKNVVIYDTVDASALRYCQWLFSGVSGITIYVEAMEEDLRWDDNFPGWSNGNKVIYGDDWHYVNFYDENGQLISSEPCRNSQIIRLPVHEIASDDGNVYEIIGWDTDGDGEVDGIPATSVVDIEAKPVVVAKEKTYLVQFVDQVSGTVYHSVELPYGAAIIAPADPQKQGHDFVRWSGLTDSMTVTGDTVIYAVWRHHGNGHEYAEPVWVEATCTEPGYNKHACTICGEFYRTGETEPLGHAYGIKEVAATCTEQGYTQHTCSRCGDSYRDGFTQAKGHEYGAWTATVAPGCVTTGEGYRICDVCGAREDTVLPAKGHSFEIVRETEATCKENGQRHYRCGDCGMETTETLPMAAHQYRKEYAHMSFLEWLIRQLLDVLWGYEGDQPYYYRCQLCGHIQTKAETGGTQAGTASSACKHGESSWEILQEATCTFGAVEGHVCALCDAVFEMRVGEELGEHNYEAVVTEPTWESGGYTTYTCVECGDSYRADFTDPLPYIPGDTDGDGTVNTDDAIYLLYNVMFGDEDYPVNQECDFDGNGTVNTDDAIYLLYHVMFGGEDYPLRN